MRNKYYKLVKDKNLSNTLDLIQGLSFSRKVEILNDLLNKYSVNIINKSLDIYKTNYIDLNRVLLHRLKNTLIYYCKRYNVNKSE